MTDDHVPPRAALHLGEVELRSFPLRSNDKRVKLSQNGVKFRTLCAGCNNGLLGDNYDRQLVSLVRGVAAHLLPRLRQDVIGSMDFTVRADPHRVAKAVVGHVLAANRGADTSKTLPSTIAGDALRPYFLDPLAPVPDGYNIYYWLYPPRRVVVMPGVVYLDARSGGTMMGDLLKFFPLAF